LANTVLAIVMRVLFGWYRKKARASGLEPRFHAVPAPTEEEMAELVAKIAKRVEGLLERRGWPMEGELCPMEEDPDDAQTLLVAASMEGRAALGRRAGRWTRRMGLPRDPGAPPRRCAAMDGYNLHADTSIARGDRRGLERVCRYLLRPPLAKARIEEDENGDIVVGLKRPWSDGTTRIVLSPLEFLERLAALVPPPRRNTVVYHGILAAHARNRAKVIPRHDEKETDLRRAITLVRPGRASTRSRRYPWAELLERVFHFDAFLCPRCQGRMQLRAVVIGGPATTRILEGIQKAVAA